MNPLFVKCIDGKWSIFEHLEKPADPSLADMHIKGVPWYLSESMATRALQALAAQSMNTGRKNHESNSLSNQ